MDITRIVRVQYGYYPNLTQKKKIAITITTEESFNGRDFLLKRSYSFGFEQNLASERMVMEPAQRHHGGIEEEIFGVNDHRRLDP